MKTNEVSPEKERREDALERLEEARATARDLVTCAQLAQEIATQQVWIARTLRQLRMEESTRPRSRSSAPPPEFHPCEDEP